MNITTTGIAVAVALVVIAAFFIFPGFWPFGSLSGATQQPTTTASATTNQIATSTMSDTTTADPTQLQITDQVVGTGAVAQAGDSVTVNYVGTLTNGTVFDASANHGTTGFTFTLGVGQVIAGWDQGIVGMKVGGQRTLVIPASLAYGAQSPAPSIPPNSALIFQVELLKVTPAK